MKKVKVKENIFVFGTNVQTYPQYFSLNKDFEFTEGDELYVIGSNDDVINLLFNDKNISYIFGVTPIKFNKHFIWV